ncbi:MAG: hypothetical protein Q9218_002277 [Villophora microphyllina]
MPPASSWPEHMEYSGIMPCVYGFLEQFNQAVRETDQHKAGDEAQDTCAICYDTISAGPMRSSLYMVALPVCGHRFHEVCLLKWLSPIALPSNTQKVLLSPTPDGGLSPISTALQTLPPSQLNVPPSWEGLSVLAGAIERLVDEFRISSASPDIPEHQLDMMLTQLEHLVAQTGRELATRRSRGDLAPPEDELEEGEIREDETDDQGIPSINLFNGTFRPAALQTNHPTAISHCCPLCRQPAFYSNPECHGDVLILLRARLRLTGLAYACYEIERDVEEEATILIADEFLDRRHHDNHALREQEIMLDPSEAKSGFKIARLLLIESCYSRLRHLDGPAGTTQRELLQLITFFTHFVMRENHIGYFFDPNPRDVSEWDLKVLVDDPLLIYKRPEVFCRELRLKAEPVDRADQVDTHNRSVERANVDRIRMANAALLDDSHDDDTWMEEIN